MDDIDIRRPRGFRLIDLLVVLGILGILAAILLPAVSRVREAAARCQCLGHLTHLGLAIHYYADTYNKSLPPLSGVPISSGVAHPQSILLTLTPFVEDDTVYTESMLEPDGHTWKGIDRHTGGPIFSTTIIRTFVCPSDSSNSTTQPTARGWAGSSYAANAQVFANRPRVVTDPKTAVTWNELASDFTIDAIPDGTSNTIFLAERFAMTGGLVTGTPCSWVNPPAGGAGLGNTEFDALGCPLQHFVSNHGVIRASVCGPATFFGSGTQDDPVGARGGVWKYPLPEIDATPRRAATDARPQAQHTGVVQVGMGDGSTRGIRRAVNIVTWVRAISPDDGQPLGSDR
jgi:type II secretory pathway pseudopilin PulG